VQKEDPGWNEAITVKAKPAKTGQYISIDAPLLWILIKKAPKTAACAPTQKEHAQNGWPKTFCV